MVERQTIKAGILRLALVCVMVAVSYAPIAAAFQMRNLYNPKSLSEHATMPCHGSADAASHSGGPSDDGNRHQQTAMMMSCACTPWCHATLGTVVEFGLALLPLRFALPQSRAAAAKTASVQPLFKPPRA